MLKIENFSLESNGGGEINGLKFKQTGGAAYRQFWFTPFVESKHFSFSFRIIKQLGGGYLIGFGDGNQNKTSYIGSDKKGWAWHAGGSIYHSGSNSSGITYQSGDVVGMEINKIENKIFFIKNGERKEIKNDLLKMEEFPERIQIAATAYSTNDEMQLVDFIDHESIRKLEFQKAVKEIVIQREEKFNLEIEELKKENQELRESRKKERESRIKEINRNKNKRSRTKIFRS